MIAWHLGRVLTLQEILDGRQDKLLDGLFQHARRFPGKVVMRMRWEMNVDVARHGLAYRAVRSLAQFKEAWAYVYVRATVVNEADNVSFFFCANGRDVGVFTMKDYFPGSAYIDHIGFDTYNETHHRSWGSFDERMQPGYDRCAALHRSAPISVGELGTVNFGGPSSATKATWLSAMFQSLLFPRLRHIDFFSVRKGLDSRIDETPTAVNVCRRFLPLGMTS